MARVGDLLAGKYRLTRELGHGGMAAVFEAEHEQIGKRVAIKVLQAERLRDEKARARFVREARAAARTGHPSIVEVHDIGEEPDGTHFIVMELLEGRSLADLVKDRGVLDVDVALHVTRQVLSALEAAHGHGVFHRDIKPQNIYVLEGEGALPRVKVLDFGVAKLDVAEGGMRLTGTGVAVGTPAYMAPEQALGRKDVDHRVDLWAAGVVLYLCLTGRKPFSAKNHLELVDRMIASDYAPVSSLRPGLPAGLEAFVARALAPDLERRFASAAAMRDALDAVTGDDEGYASTVRDRPDAVVSPPDEDGPTTEYDASGDDLPAAADLEGGTARSGGWLAPAPRAPASQAAPGPDETDADRTTLPVTGSSEPGPPGRARKPPATLRLEPLAAPEPAVEEEKPPLAPARSSRLWVLLVLLGLLFLAVAATTLPCGGGAAGPG